MQWVTLRADARVPRPGKACGLMLGHFDGVHLGHRALADKLRAENADRLPLGALCFSSPPARALSAAPAPQLTDTDEKLALLGAAGLDFAVLLEFDAVRDLSPAAFVRDVLLGACRAQLIVCGFNYTFGARGAGTPETLAALCADAGRRLFVQPPVLWGGQAVSSTRIRLLLEAGHADEAAALLSYPYFLTGTVQNGRHVGRKLGAPTANLAIPPDKLVPAHGVYIACAAVGGRTYPAVCNIGVHPTFGAGEAVCEVHLLDFSGDLYGAQMRVFLLSFVRPETAFATPEALEAAISSDRDAAARYFAAHPTATAIPFST